MLCFTLMILKQEGGQLSNTTPIGHVLAVPKSQGYRLGARVGGNEGTSELHAASAGGGNPP